jgi:protein-L-isoaspartate O-methyltransferase
LLAARRGPFDAAVLGGAAASMPDLEHLLPWLRPRGEMLFHRGRGRHGIGITVETQLLLAGATVGWLLARRR